MLWLCSRRTSTLSSKVYLQIPNEYQAKQFTGIGNALEILDWLRKDGYASCYQMTPVVDDRNATLKAAEGHLLISEQERHTDQKAFVGDWIVTGLNVLFVVGPEQYRAIFVES